MIRISLAYVYDFATKVEPLSRLPNNDVDLMEVFWTLIEAEKALDGLYHQSFYAQYLRSSYALGESLLSQVRVLSQRPLGGGKAQAFELIRLRQSFEQFKIAFNAELNVVNAYFVLQQSGFDTYTLLQNGVALFPDSLSQKVPEAVYDIKEAAKCLAYQMPTSCGFHVFRATESVLRKYYSHVTGGMPLPKVRNMGVYLRAMNNAGVGDEKVKSVLAQLIKFYRNPLIHPEAVLTDDEAITIIGLCRSLVTEMLSALPSPPLTTSSALTVPSGT